VTLRKRKDRSLHPNLDPVTQAALIGSIVMLTGVVLIRAVAFLRGEYAGLPHRYPCGWTNDQTRVFERFRLWTGVVLAITWVVLELAAPRMPQSWPFGLEEIILTAGLLLLTNAWILLLMPSNWQTIAQRLSFSTAMGLLACWWLIFLGGMLISIMLASSSPAGLTIPLGTYAFGYG
jgi:hypothetical protein